MTTAVALTTAILLGAIVATSVINTEAFAKKSNTITLAFHECSGSDGNHKVHCSCGTT